MNKVNLKIITPNGIKFDKSIDIFNTTTVEGAIGVNINCLGLIAKLTNNISVVNVDSNTKIEFVILNGLLYSTKSEIKVFTDYCEEKSNIDINSLKKEIEQLNNKLKTTTNNFQIQSINFHLKQLNEIINCFK